MPNLLYLTKILEICKYYIDLILKQLFKNWTTETNNLEQSLNNRDKSFKNLSK